MIVNEGGCVWARSSVCRHHVLSSRAGQTWHSIICLSCIRLSNSPARKMLLLAFMLSTRKQKLRERDWPRSCGWNLANWTCPELWFGGQSSSLCPNEVTHATYPECLPFGHWLEDQDNMELASTLHLYSWMGMPRWEFCFHQLWTGWTWASNLYILCLSFCICKINEFHSSCLSVISNIIKLLSAKEWLGLPGMGTELY